MASDCMYCGVKANRRVRRDRRINCSLTDHAAIAICCHAAIADDEQPRSTQRAQRILLRITLQQERNGPGRTRKEHKRTIRQDTAPAVGYLTVTVKQQLELLPLASVATEFTVVVPFGKVEPDAGVETIVMAPGQLSVAVTVKFTTALH